MICLRLGSIVVSFSDIPICFHWRTIILGNDCIVKSEGSNADH